MPGTLFLQDAQLDEFETAAYAGLEAALLELAKRTYQASRVLVPVDTGALRQTGIVSEVERVGDKLTVSVSYGGPLADYAVIVHENLEAQHAPPTQAKYLETAVVAVVEDSARVITDGYVTATRNVSMNSGVQPDPLVAKL